MPSMHDWHFAQDWDLTQDFYLQQLGQLHDVLQQKNFRKAEVQQVTNLLTTATHSAQSVWQFIPFHKRSLLHIYGSLQLFLKLKKKDFIIQKHLNTVQWSSCHEFQQ